MTPAEKKAAAKKLLAEKAAAKKLKEEEDAKAAAAADSDDAPTEQDIINAFGSFLSPDLDKAVRTERAAFVRPLVARFGVARATDLEEGDRKLALNLLQRKIAGQDIDPENDEFEEFEAEEESLV